MMELIAELILFGVPAIPVALALWAWRRDRGRLGPVRRWVGWTALGLTTAAFVLFVVFLLRLGVINQRRVSLDENLRDWAWTVARSGALVATVAVPMNAISIGRARLFGLLAAVLLGLLYLSWAAMAV
jgi:hypothetical protein